MIDDLLLEQPELLEGLDERKQFTEEQAHVLGSTDGAQILRLARFGSPLTVYRRLIGELKPRPPSLPAWIGSRIEDVVAELCMTATETPLRADNLHHTMPGYPYIGCHLDRRVVGSPKTLVELKTRARQSGWGEPGTDKIPVDTWTQVQHQMMVVGADECWVAVLFGLGSDFAVYRILADTDFQASYLETLVEFWTMYVVPRIPPPPTGRPDDTAYLQATPGGYNRRLKPATPEMNAVVGEFRLAHTNASQAASALEEQKNKLRALIGEDYDGLESALGTIWWRRAKDSTVVDWVALAETYRQIAEELLSMANPGEDEDLVRKLAVAQATLPVAPSLYTSTRPGVRRVVPTWRNDA